MNTAKRIAVFFGGRILLVFFILSSSAILLQSQDLPRHDLKPLTIWGSSAVVYSTGDGQPSTGGFNIRLRHSSNPVNQALVRVDGKLDLRQINPGWYQGFIRPYDVYANRPIEIIIRPGLPLSPERDQITARGLITDIVEIIAPAWDAIIDLAMTRVITVRWRFKAGGGPLAELRFYEGSSGGPVVFEKLNVPGDSIIVRTSILRPDHQYTIELSRLMKDFDLRGNVSPDSRISLVAITKTRINTK